MTAMTQKAALFRAEGVLFDQSALSFVSFLSLNSPGFWERIPRFGSALLVAPLAPLFSRAEVSSALAYLPLRGLTRDRIDSLAEEYFEEYLKPKFLPQAGGLLRQAAKRNESIVILSELLGPVVEHVVSHAVEVARVEVDAWYARDLEYLRDRATGQILSSPTGRPYARSWLKTWAADQRVDLEQSSAFGAYKADIPLLTSVGNPCAVNPSFRLRQAAREEDWKISFYR